MPTASAIAALATPTLPIMGIGLTEDAPVLNRRAP